MRLRASVSASSSLGAQRQKSVIIMLGPAILAVHFAVALDRRKPHRPRAVGEHHHVGAEARRRIHRILARRDGVDAPVEAWSSVILSQP
jgi:hypothetical protein